MTENIVVQLNVECRMYDLCDSLDPPLVLYDEKFTTSKKLIGTLDDKKYTVHERHLKLGLDNGLKMECMQKVILFKESKFLKAYVEHNDKKRAEV